MGVRCLGGVVERGQVTVRSWCERGDPKKKKQKRKKERRKKEKDDLRKEWRWHKGGERTAGEGSHVVSWGSRLWVFLLVFFLYIIFGRLGGYKMGCQATFESPQLSFSFFG